MSPPRRKKPPIIQTKPSKDLFQDGSRKDALNSAFAETISLAVKHDSREILRVKALFLKKKIIIIIGKVGHQLASMRDAGV